MNSPSINTGKQALYESGVSIAFQSSLVIGRAIKQKAVTNTKKYSAGNLRHYNFQGSPPKQVTQADGKYGARFSRAQRGFKDKASTLARTRY